MPILFAKPRFALSVASILVLAACSDDTGNSPATTPTASAGNGADNIRVADMPQSELPPPAQPDAQPGAPVVPSAPSELAPGEVFPASLLTEYKSWSPVTKGDKPFVSKGHGGVSVKSYFNAKAKPTYEGTTAFPFAQGSVLAKAVLSDPANPNSPIRRVYFMRKMDANYDPANGNWAYRQADLKDGKLILGPSQGRLQGCIGCHSGQKAFDYAQTVEIYRKDRFAPEDLR